jgi:hypothetical protein
MFKAAIKQLFGVADFSLQKKIMLFQEKSIKL